MNDNIVADRRLMDIIDLRGGLVSENDPLIRDIRICQSLTNRKYIRILAEREDQVIFEVTEAGAAYAESVKVSLGN